MEAVAKYCNEHVCVCACVSLHEDTSWTTHAIFTKCFVHVAYGHSSVLLQWGDKIPKGWGKLGVFIPTDNALWHYSGM